MRGQREKNAFLLQTATEMPLALMPFIYTGDDSVTTHASLGTALCTCAPTSLSPFMDGH